MQFKVEIRETDDGPRIRGVILQEGRAADTRREVFAPGSVVWPSDGIGLLVRHHGNPECRTIPTRTDDGALAIDAPATPALVAAVEAGRDQMSVEFHALREVRTRAGVREIRRAMVIAATVTDRPDYPATSAEIRERRRARGWL